MEFISNIVARDLYPMLQGYKVLTEFNDFDKVTFQVGMILELVNIQGIVSTHWWIAGVMVIKQ